MMRGITHYQRQQARYTMDWERFMDRLVLIVCVGLLLWSLLRK